MFLVFLSKNGPYQKVINHCLDKELTEWHRAKGFAFEIKTALDFNRRGDEILEFGKKVEGRDIDIITEKFWIECKDWNWDLVPSENIAKLFSTSGQLRKIAADANREFALSFHGLVPTEIKDQLISMNIKFFEL